MTFLLMYWKYVAVALFVVAYTGFVYHAGGTGPKEELKTYKAQVEALGKAQEEKVKKVETQQKEIVSHVNQSTQAAISRSDAYYRRLRLHPGSGPLPVPANTADRITQETAPTSPYTNQCDPADGAADALVIVAWQKFYSDLQAAQK